MAKKTVIHPEYKKLFNDCGLNSFDDFFTQSDGQIVDKNRKRCVLKFNLFDKANKKNRIFYLKKFHTPSFKNGLSALFYYGYPKSEARIEWDNACLLRSSGFNTIPLAAYGVDTVCGFERASFFMSEEISDSQPLDIWFDQNKNNRQNVLRTLGQLVRRLHEKRFSFPDLYLKHIFINSDTMEFSLLDLHRVRRKKRLLFGDKIRDIAALLFSADSVLNKADNAVWMDIYFEGVSNRLKWDKALKRRLSTVRARRSHGRGVFVRQLPSANSMLFVNEQFYPLFTEKNISNFDDLFHCPTDGILLTDNPGRVVDTLTFKHGTSTDTFFIKKHERKKQSGRWGENKKIISAAQTEWKNHLICRKFGILVPTPVAWGYRTNPVQSVMVTLGVKESVSVESLLRDGYFAKHRSMKKVFIRNIAQIASNLHCNNCFHKDFYTGHILVQGTSGDDLSFFLIDLQRVAGKFILKQRWIVKDLAQMNFTSRYADITLKDRIRFMHYYLDIKKLDRYGRRLVKKIDSKTRRIQNHIPKVLRRKNIDSWDQVADYEKTKT